MEKILEVGMHLILDGYCQDSSIIGNLGEVHRFLDEFPEEMGMTKSLPPYVSNIREQFSPWIVGYQV